MLSAVTSGSVLNDEASTSTVGMPVRKKKEQRAEPSMVNVRTTNKARRALAHRCAYVSFPAVPQRIAKGCKAPPHGSAQPQEGYSVSVRSQSTVAAPKWLCASNADCVLPLTSRRIEPGVEGAAFVRAQARVCVRASERACMRVG
jgi:hypothetical protein